MLEYFDLKKTTQKGDATGIIAMIGEDLGAAIFKHHYETVHKGKIQISDVTPTVGGKRGKGKKLDRWILTQKHNRKTLYQTEIKNWCARAIGGIDIPIDSSPKELKSCVRKNWARNASSIDTHKLEQAYFHFDYCWIFSCSLYLRHLLREGNTQIELDMPNAQRRIGQLRRLFQ
ncbi:MAG: hypothetical protein HY007_02140 [Candidatus Sungbacteria bacterium]|nr:hypothetical protein [Candidatus Sungbacteria bacterium]